MPESRTLTPIESFFSNFCVCQTNEYNDVIKTEFFQNIIDAKYKVLEIRENLVQENERALQSYKNKEIDLQTYDNIFDNNIRTNTEIFEVNRFNSKNNQKKECEKKCKQMFTQY